MYDNTGINYWCAPTASFSGYGLLQYQVIRALMDLKINIKPINPSVYIQDFKACPEWYKAWMNNNYTNEPVELFQKILAIQYPSQLNCIEGQTLIGYTMFESEKPPALIIKCLQRVPYLIVPCEQNITAFRNAGLTQPIFKVHLGNDQSQYHFLERDWDISEENPFTFLHMGATNWRKGHDVAIKAFKHVFAPDNKKVRLVLKVSHQYTPQWQINSMNTADKRIILIKDHLSDSEMLNLYEAGHCSVAPTRGDAWNLLAFQALATGMPSITTNYCGPVEYQHLSYPLNYNMKYCDQKVFGEDWGYYGEPDFEHLCELMKFAYENPGKCRVKGIEASNEIKEKFTWNHTAQKILDVINQIS